MSVASSYARALHELVAKDSAKASAYIKNLQASLAKRGTLKLLPAIVGEYDKLEIAEARRVKHATVTPEKERVRVLLSLYKKLVEPK